MKFCFTKILFPLPILLSLVSCKTRHGNSEITATPKVERPPQFVALAFDGSYNLDFWKESTQFAEENNLKFTYFTSCVYFIPDAQKNSYMAPKNGTGKSAIGFGGTESEISERVKLMKAAFSKGHELQSHACGHFDGGSWSFNDWNSEFTQFDLIMKKVTEKNNFSFPKMFGFRAPLLGVSEGLWPVLKKNNFRYDTSLIAPTNYWPQKNKASGWNFPLAQLVIVGSGKKTLSMDYNFYYTHSKGQKDPNPENQQRYEEEMYNTYMKYFNSNYLGNRAPVHIGHHFSKWNGGAYWRAMQRFAKAVCGKAEVKCATYSELANFIDSNETKIASYKIGNFDKMPASTLSLNEDEAQELKTISPADACALGEKDCTGTIESLGYHVPHNHDLNGSLQHE